MLTKTLAKIDRYYPILAVVVIGLTVLLIFTLRGIFLALNTASQFDTEQVEASLKVKKEKLDALYQKVKERKVPALTGYP